MPIQLTEKDIADLKAQGYTEQQIREALGEIQREEVTGVRQPQSLSQYSSFQYNPTDNLIKWQLEVNDILERAEHILRDDRIAMEDGKMIWVAHPDPKQRVLNDYGVQEIMRTLSNYINRNTILSDYDPEEIRAKVFDFGKEINDLIFMKYEDFGMTSLEKRKNYPMLVRELIDIVHSAYNRSKYGRERDSLKTVRQIMQQEQITPTNFNVQTGEIKKKGGLLHPLKFIAGRR